MVELIWDERFKKIYKKWSHQHPKLKEQFAKKTRMKPKTSHQNNENFAFTTQFPDVWITVGKSQNFHGKVYLFIDYFHYHHFFEVKKYNPAMKAMTAKIKNIVFINPRTNNTIVAIAVPAQQILFSRSAIGSDIMKNCLYQI